ncbi:hypothetical protein GCM10010106_48360 [Thermopolyspora flexuosa]|nr:hypothetical protein GCM10010106_48360 [Thermopolyspora flexuosa]
MRGRRRVRLDRHAEVADEDLAGAGRCELHGHHGEITGFGQPCRESGEMDLTGEERTTEGSPRGNGLGPGEHHALSSNRVRDSHLMSLHETHRTCAAFVR